MKRPSSVDDLRFFDRSAIERGENRLPHWQQEGGTYFVSFRLADSIPQHRLRERGSERASWLARNPPPWLPEQEGEYHEPFTAQIEAWCDEGAGGCVLRQPPFRAIVSGALAHFDSHRHWQLAWVVMPNHVHALFSPIGNHALTDIVKSWKGFTAREIHRDAAQIGQPDGALWMKNYFDRIVRDAAHFWRCARYIRRNPQKARLAPDEFTLFEAPFVQQQLDFETGLNRSGGFPAADSKSPNERTGRLESRPSVKTRSVKT